MKFKFNMRVFIVCFLVFMWVWLMVFFWIKTDEVTRDPCSICAERMGEDVMCTTKGFIPITRTYYPNGNISDNTNEITNQAAKEKDSSYSDIDLSGLESKLG